VSQDLTRDTWEVPASVGIYRGSSAAAVTRRGVIYAVAVSPIDANTIWIGTDDGLIHRTRDGGRNWTDVTPAQLGPWAKVSILEASHFDANTAYAAINTLRLDDLHPHIYRTRDAGKTWTRIAEGLPDDAPINAVREDTQRRGLLFAGSERAVHLSFDDGEHWQSLRLNMPATSIRDLAIKDDDLIVATHGRGFWILDDITPLRQLTADVAKADVFLFRPGTAWRFRWNKNTDTPPPPDEPAAPNPPDGVVISYLLGANAPVPVTLELIETATSTILRRYSSDDPVEPPIPGRNIPDYWIRPPQKLETTAGLHRFVWDLRFAPPPVDTFEYPIAAVAHNTPKEPRGLWVMPGTYQVRLTVGSRVIRQAVTVKMDLRVRTPVADLSRQYTLSRSIDDTIRQLADARRTATQRRTAASGDLAAKFDALAKSLDDAYAPLPDLFSKIQEADLKPTPATEAATAAALERAQQALALFNEAMRE
jgi:hypothetical protein